MVVQTGNWKANGGAVGKMVGVAGSEGAEANMDGISRGAE